jgi:DNA-binding NarL/FixJ family response regulator
MTTIMIIDDHPIVRQGLRTLLEADQEFTVVGETADGTAAIAMAEWLRPDIVITDLLMPGISGLEVIHQIARRVPTTRIVVLTMHSDEAYAVEALRHGALAYVIKEARSDLLLHAISETLAGRRYLSPPLSEDAVEAYVLRASKSTVNPLDHLTNREREVLALVAQSYTNTEIAALLSISSRTVELHRKHAMHKLGLQSHTDLIRFAIKHGIIPLDG